MFNSTITNHLNKRSIAYYKNIRPRPNPTKFSKLSLKCIPKNMSKAEKRIIKKMLADKQIKKMKTLDERSPLHKISHTAPVNYDYSNNMITIANVGTGGLSFFGSISENAQRILANSPLRSKFDSLLITGRLDWSSIAGLPGYLLTLAELPNVRPLNICYPNDHLKLLLSSCRHFILRKSIGLAVDTTKAIKSLGGMHITPIITYPTDSNETQPDTDFTKFQLKFLDECIADTFTLGTKDSAGNNSDNFADADVKRNRLVNTLIEKVKVKEMSVSYLVKFESVGGKFDPIKSDELGVHPTKRGLLLKEGQLTLENGNVIKSSDVTSKTRRFEDMLILHVVNDDYLKQLKLQLTEQKEFDSSNTGLVYLTLDKDVTLDQELFDFVDLLTAKTLPDSNIFISHPEVNSNHFMINDYASSYWHFKNLLPQNFPELNITRTTNSNFFEKYTHLLPQRRSSMVGFKPEGEIPDIKVSKVNIFNQNDTVVLRAFDDSSEESIAEKKLFTLKNPNYKPEKIVNKYTRNKELLSKNPRVSLRDRSVDPKIAILGTFSSKPGLASNVSSNLVKIPVYNKDIKHYDFTFGYMDAGEGSYNTLRRLSTDEELAYIFHNMKFIYLSHLHADHLGGIITMINHWYAYNKEDTDKKLYLLVPSRFINFVLESFSNNHELLNRIIAFSNEIFKNTKVGKPLKTVACTFMVDSKVFSVSDAKKFVPALEKMTSELALKNFETVNAIHCLESYSASFTFQLNLEKNFKISISGDTRPNPVFANIGADSDFLIHEATFQNDMRDHAWKKQHSTVGEALSIAAKMKAKNVILTHFSSRKLNEFLYGTEEYINDESNMKVCVASDGIIVDSLNMEAVHQKTLKDSKFGEDIIDENL